MGQTSIQVLLIIAFLITGTMQTIVCKWQNKTNFLSYNYSHPVLQSLFTYFSLIPSYIVYALFYRKIPSDPFKYKAYFLLTGALDVVENIMLSYGLLFIAASVYQMARSSTLIFVMFFSWIVLSRRPNMWNVIGVAILVLSVTTLGLAELFYPTENEDNHQLVVGLILIVLSQIICSIILVLEEKYLKQVRIHPTEAVAIEGIIGFAITAAIAIPIFHYIPCNISSWCPTGRMDDAALGFKQVFTSGIGIVQLLLLFVSVLVLNIIGMVFNITIGVTAKVVLDCGRMLLMWVFALSIKWERFNWIQGIGFIGIVGGILVYNEIFSKCRCNKADYATLAVE